MSDTTAPSNNKKVTNATQLVDKLEFTEGISAKSGNPYLVGALYIESPISDEPIRLSFEYIDANTRALIKMAIDKSNKDAITDFQSDK